MQNRNRYDSLNVSMQTDNVTRKRNPSELNKTIELEPSKNRNPRQLKTIEQSNLKSVDQQKERYFHQLYRKNEDLRRELKLISMKLSEKIQKVKFNPLKKKTGIAPEKTDHALRKELENVYKQLNMYKKQIQTLKIKQENQVSIQKLTFLQNQIAFKDSEITQMQNQLKGIKIVKDLQQKKLSMDVENEQIKNMMANYSNEVKQLKEKLKQIAKKERKRQQNYKKQQAYLYQVEKKLREVNQMYHPGIKKQEETKELKNNSIEQKGQISEEEWRIVKSELEKQKQTYKNIGKKIELTLKQIKNEKQQRVKLETKLKENQQNIDSVKKKIAEIKKLVNQKQSKEQTSSIDQTQKQIYESSENSKPKIGQDSSSEQKTVTMNNNNQLKMWTGEERLQQRGYAEKQDLPFNDAELVIGKNSRMIGINFQMDDDNQICTIQAIYMIQNSVVSGKKSSNFEGTQLKWELKNGDYVKAVSGVLNANGCFEYLVLTSKNGKIGRFGNLKSNQNLFNFNLQDQQFPRYIFGASRKLGKDTRISQLGLCIVHQPKN